MTDKTLIPYLKGTPENLLPELLIIRDYTKSSENPNVKNKDELINEIINKVLRRDEYNEAYASNFIYARAIPTLEKLGLILKEKNYIGLTPIGKALITDINKEDYDFSKGKIYDMLYEKFKIKFGKVLLQLDPEKWCIIKSLETVSPFINPITIDNLIKKIEEYGKESKSTRLIEVLRYYEFANLLFYKNGKVILNRQALEKSAEIKLLNDEKDLENDKFEKALYAEYKYLIAYQSKNHNGLTFSISYIPIKPDLENLVCYNLMISEETFNKFLLDTTVKSKKYKVMLAPAREHKENSELLKSGRNYYYYIAIFENGKEL